MHGGAVVGAAAEGAPGPRVGRAGGRGGARTGAGLFHFMLLVPHFALLDPSRTFSAMLGALPYDLYVRRRWRPRT